MKHLILYDVSDPKRLNRVAKTIKDYGVRVQKSVFEADLTRQRLREMKRRVEQEIEPDDDAVKYVPLCVKCAGKIEIIGRGVLIDPDEEYDVL